MEEEEYPRRDHTYKINNSIKIKVKISDLKVGNFETYFFMLPLQVDITIFAQYKINWVFFLLLWFRSSFTTHQIYDGLLLKSIKLKFYTNVLCSTSISQLFTFTDEI